MMEDELSAALPPTERSAVFGTKVIGVATHEATPKAARQRVTHPFTRAQRTAQVSEVSAMVGVQPPKDGNRPQSMRPAPTIIALKQI